MRLQNFVPNYAKLCEIMQNYTKLKKTALLLDVIFIKRDSNFHIGWFCFVLFTYLMKNTVTTLVLQDKRTDDDSTVLIGQMDKPTVGQKAENL